MIRVIFLFLVLGVLAYLGIKAAEKITGRQLIKLTKVVGYVIVSASIAFAVMFGMVIFF